MYKKSVLPCIRASTQSVLADDPLPFRSGKLSPPSARVCSCKANPPKQIPSPHLTMGHVAHPPLPSRSFSIYSRDALCSFRPAPPCRTPSNSQTHGSRFATPPAVCPPPNTSESPPVRFPAKSFASQTTPPGLPLATLPTQECSAASRYPDASVSQFPPQIRAPTHWRTPAMSPCFRIHILRR